MIFRALKLLYYQIKRFKKRKYKRILGEKEIYEAFETLGLASEHERQKILFQGVVEPKDKPREIISIIEDNITIPNKQEE